MTATPAPPPAGALIEIEGHCPICNRDTRFVAKSRWLRGSLICPTCPNGSVPRERALALVLERTVPDWRKRAIFESSPAKRGISLKLAAEAPGYVAAQFFPDHPLGESVDGIRNENLERLTFPEKTFDLVVTLDVFEHVLYPECMMQEIQRVLVPGGIYLSTFPIHKTQAEAVDPRVALDEKGALVHVKEPQYHGNPVSADGSLVTFDYGYDIHARIAEWAGFEVEVTRFARARAGILGEYTEVITCIRP